MLAWQSISLFPGMLWGVGTYANHTVPQTVPNHPALARVHVQSERFEPLNTNHFGF